MGPKPSRGFPGVAPVAVALTLIAACGDARPIRSPPQVAFSTNVPFSRPLFSRPPSQAVSSAMAP